MFTKLEFSILDAIHNNLSCGFLDTFFVFFTKLGDAGLIWFVIGAILLCIRKYRKGALVMLCAMAFGFLTGNLIMKPLIARSRPCWLVSVTELIIENPTDFSFPSGHTLSSVICCTVLVMLDRRLGMFAIPLAAFISFSRLYLYVHFPSDVLFSVAYGILVALLTWHIAKKHFGIKSLNN
ncbi:MAG: phosphatase PAP2 family protein [Clostridia bacterium]|nr:phosphatase PAP2 family protein [Clostridia bacterium]